MKKLFLILAIVLLLACVFSLLVAAFSLFGYYHVLDGSPQLYDKLQHRAVRCFILGAVFAVITVVCFVLRAKF